MKHFLILLFFAGAVALVFGWLGREQTRERWLYGLKIFAEFVAIGLALAWLLYWLPF